MTDLTHNAYYVGIICPFKIEFAAMCAMLDEEHGRLDTHDPNDHIVYFAGCIHRHNVVIACLPAGVDGIGAAATVTKNMLRTFSEIRFMLLVGVRWGISNPTQGIDVSLGDVIVSQPHGIQDGLFQIDEGRDKVASHWERKGSLNAPPAVLLTALQSLQAEHELNDGQVSIYLHNTAMSRPKLMELGYGHPGIENDVIDSRGIASLTNEKKRKRPARDEWPTTDPARRYKTFASGKAVRRDASLRDFMRNECAALCVEMEAVGLMKECPCLVVRGISDYVDENKSVTWRRYATTTAAAFAKEFLLHVSVRQVVVGKMVQRFLGVISVQSKNTPDLIRKQDEQKLYRKCHQALHTSTYAAFKNFNRKAFPGTCQWLLQHPKFLDWSQSSSNTLLWISADPGCGKSVISRHLIDVVLSLEAGSTSTQHIPHSICYFFFRDNDKQNSLPIALSAVLHQLFLQQPRLISHAVPAYKAGGNQLSSDAGQLWNILLNASKDPNSEPITCIFDGLDECVVNDRKQFIDYLCRFYDTHARTLPNISESVKILVTSRPCDDIQDAFEQIPINLPPTRIRGENENENDQIHNEINLAIEAYMVDLSRELRLSQCDANNIKSELFKMENRTYLWLSLTVDHIKSTFQRSLNAEKEHLIPLPRSVDEAYEQLLVRVEERSIGHQIELILSIITGSRRALSVREIALALDVATESSRVSNLRHFSIDPDRLRENISQWCGSFIYIHHDHLYLVHQTAKEFLLRQTTKNAMNSWRWKQCLHRLDVEQVMANICVVYLNVHEFNESSLDPWMRSLSVMKSFRTGQNAKEQGLVSQYEQSLKLGDLGLSEVFIKSAVSFFEYAAKHWASHFRFAQRSINATTYKQSLNLYSCSSLLFRRINHFISSKHNFRSSNNILHAILLAAFNGHSQAIGVLMDRSDVHIDAIDATLGKTALTVAAEQGNVDIVRRLLSNGADPNIQFGCGNTALSIAAQNGHRSVIKTILKRQSCDDFALGGSFVQALKHGHDSIVDLLLNSGMDIRMDLDKWGLPLNPEKSSEDKRLLTRLQQTGISLNSYDGWGCALHMAVWKGDYALVKKLVDMGGNINAQCMRTGSVLRTACLVNNEKIIRFLWEKRAGIKLSTGFFFDDDAFRTAARYCGPEIVKGFIERKTYCDEIHLDGTGALQAASARGDDTIVKLFLDYGADVNDRNSIFGTPLLAAAEKGHANMVSILLSHGADMKAQCGRQGTALHVASAQGHIQVVRLLLQAGIDVDLPGGQHHSALQAAACNGHADVVRILSTKVADLNVEGGDNCTALHAAAIHGHSEVVKILLRAGANANLSCALVGGTAIYVAFGHGHYDVVQCMLEAGVDLADFLDECSIDDLQDWYDEIARITSVFCSVREIKDWLDEMLEWGMIHERFTYFSYPLGTYDFETSEEDNDPRYMFDDTRYDERDWGDNIPDYEPDYYSEYGCGYYSYAEWLENECVRDYEEMVETENAYWQEMIAAEEAYWQDMISAEEVYLLNVVEAETMNWPTEQEQNEEDEKTFVADEIFLRDTIDAEEAHWQETIAAEEAYWYVVGHDHEEIEDQRDDIEIEGLLLGQS